MTIAITTFDGLCGFRPLAEIAHFLRTVDPLAQLVGKEAAESFIAETQTAGKDHKRALQRLFDSLMHASAAAVTQQAGNLLKVAKTDGDHFAGAGGPSNSGRELAQLIIRLNDQFPADIGLFVLFLLNYVKLEPGEAMFLKADDIHAYLSGGGSFP